MTEPTSSATQTVVVSPPRLPGLLPLIYGGLGAIVAVGGLLVTIGGWRGEVDNKLATLDRRMDVAESNQRTYIPVLVAMQANLAYLADRARREDDRRERERVR